MTRTFARLFSIVGFLSVGVPVVSAGSPSEQPTVSSRVEELRQLAESARAGAIPPSKIPAIKELRQFLAQEPSFVENMQTANRSSVGLPTVVSGQAQRRDKFPLDCREIQRRFHLAKAYWNQMLCVVDRIIYLSAQPCPDLHCIKLLRHQADILKEKIDLTYPPQWDQRSVNFSRRWTFHASDYSQKFDAFFGRKQILASNPEAKLQITGVRRVKWRGVFWDDIATIPYTQFVTGDDYVDVAQQLSVTNYCMEPMRIELTLTGQLSGQEDHPFGVHLHF